MRYPFAYLIGPVAALLIVASFYAGGIWLAIMPAVFYLLLPIGDTKQNLESAIAGETHEYTDMYPGMAKSARDEGFGEIADWFETLAKAEKSHAGRFQKGKDSLD